MILNKETLEKFGHEADKLTYGSKLDIVVQCDYCQNNYDSTPDRINRSRKKLNKDACSNCKYLKQKESFISNYGVPNPSNIKEVQIKRENTFLERYGVKNPTQNKEIRDRVDKTCIERYGDKSPIRLPEIQDKIKAGFIEKYGVESPNSLPEVQEKRKQTCLKRYGCQSPNGNKEVQHRKKNTTLAKYGYEYVTQVPQVIEKMLSTKIDKYGTTSPINMGIAQKEVQDWLQEQGFSFAPCISLLGKKEIDLYNADLKLGIEYCGLYWHHENAKTPRDRLYHYDKYRLCKEQGVRLITIFEDEWLYRKEQVKAFLQSVLGVNKKVYARKCILKEVSREIGRDFVNDNHIQDIDKPSLIYFGLYHDDVLVGILSLNRHHRTNSTDLLVLDRMCFQQGITVVGGASKLFKAAIEYAKMNGYKKIVSWSDNRWSWGNVYEKLNFQLEIELPADYSYVHLKNPDSKRKSKQSMQKSNIGCPKDMTEKDFALTLGYSRIWDCGKKRFIYHVT